MWHEVYIGLGSNLLQPQQQIQQAFKALAALPLTRLMQHSSLYQSKALTLPDDPHPQPDYLNAVACLSTQLAPESLLDALLAIEQQQGRKRTGQRWQPRPLDLDILLYGTLTYSSSRLSIPHPEIPQRAFVLYPLHECNSRLCLPDGRSVQELLAQCPAADLIRINT